MRWDEEGGVRDEKEAIDMDREDTHSVKVPTRPSLLHANGELVQPV